MTGETIVVIDSDTETAQQIVSILESEGYLVFAAPNGEVGLIMAKRVNPSLIFINPVMAGTSGLEICNAIHKIEPLKDVPIVALSAFGGAMDPRYASLYGIVDLIKKPFTPEELISKTKKVLSMKSAGVSPAEEDIEIAESEEAVIVEEIDLPEEAVVEEMSEGIEEAEHIKMPDEEPQDILREEHRETLERDIPRKGIKSKLLVPAIAVATIIILGTGGIVLYKTGLLPWPSQKIQTEPTLKQPIQPPQLPQPSEQQPTVESKPSMITPVPEVTATKKGYHSVQIGAFKNLNNAEALVSQYKEKGYDVFIHKSILNEKETLYRVLIGKFENRKEAVQSAQNIYAKEKIKAIVFSE